MPRELWIAVGAAVLLYAGFVVALLVAGRRNDARAWAGFIPDCLVLFRRLIGDSRVLRARKLLLGALLAYLAMPFDLVPDFIPIGGQLDDAIIVAFVLRMIVRSGGPELVREHWPGPAASLGVLLRLAYGRGPVPGVAQGAASRHPVRGSARASRRMDHRREPHPSGTRLLSRSNVTPATLRRHGRPRASPGRPGTAPSGRRS